MIPPDSAEETSSIILIKPIRLVVFVVIIFIVIVCFISISYYGDYSRRITAVGVIMPETGIIKLSAKKPGIISETFFKKGDKVRKGDIILKLSTETVLSKENTLQDLLINELTLMKKNSLKELISLEQTLNANLENNKSKLLKNAVDYTYVNQQKKLQQDILRLAELRVSNTTKLLSSGYVSRIEFDHYKTQFLEARNRILQTNKEISNIELEKLTLENEYNIINQIYARQVKQIDNGINEINQKIININSQKQTDIIAPNSGIISNINFHTNQYVDINNSLVTIIPENSHWIAQIYIKSDSVANIKINDRVLLRYLSFPYQKYGQQKGKVVFITKTIMSRSDILNSDAPIKILSNTNDDYYLAYIELDSQFILYKNEKIGLNSGMQIQVDIIKKNMKIYQWLLGPLLEINNH